MNVRSSSALALTLAGLVALTGCTDSSRADENLTSTTSNSTPTSTTSGQASSPTTATGTTAAGTPDEQGAEQAVTSYWAMMDAKFADQSSSLKDLSTVARGQALADMTSMIVHARTSQLHASGKTKLEMKSVAASSSTAFLVKTCVDVSDVALTDATGKSAVPTDKPARSLNNYEVTKDLTDMRFYVTSSAGADVC